MRKLGYRSLVARVHKLASRDFPATERFELGSQLRRAAYSVAANIAEGFSEASLNEVDYCLHAAWRLGYITTELLAEFESDLNGVGAPLIGLVRHVRLLRDDDTPDSARPA